MSAQAVVLQRQEALTRAVSSASTMNYGAIFEGFLAMGIPEDQIKPRENVFTFNAWKALGRSVKKGEHGVKVVTWILCERGSVTESTEGEEPKRAGFKMCKTTTVFHESQTEVRA